MKPAAFCDEIEFRDSLRLPRGDTVKLKRISVHESCDILMSSRAGRYFESSSRTLTAIVTLQISRGEMTFEIR